MFEIRCLECQEVVLLKDGINDESVIKITGQKDVTFDPFVWIQCKCGNLIQIDKF